MSKFFGGLMVVALIILAIGLWDSITFEHPLPKMCSEHGYLKHYQVSNSVYGCVGVNEISGPKIFCDHDSMETIWLGLTFQNPYDGWHCKWVGGEET